MKGRKLLSLLFAWLFCLTINLTGSQAEDLIFEKSYGNERFRYAVPQETKGPYTISNFPMEFERTYSVSVEKVWKALEKLVNSKNGVFIVKDKSSNFITFRYSETADVSLIIKDPLMRLMGGLTSAYCSRGIPPEAKQFKIYFNVYVKAKSTTETLVYATFFMPVCHGQYKNFDVEFFNELTKYISGG
ncbi:MAG: hypothetical protein PHO01_11690 [Desulfotomaculaceae bacterium]|nr:hypothetical protein [Desulfotomaculaceae bacterium]